MASLAHAADPFTVVGVPVDATADTVIAAQTEAIQDGQLRAAKIMLERLTLDSERAVKPLPEMDAEMVGKLIRALEINNERRSANRYLGDVSVAFNPREVQSFLQDRGLTMMSSQARERLIVPVGSKAFTIALANAKYAHALTPLKPSGLSEISTPDSARLEAIAAQFGTQQILLVEELSASSAQVTDIALDTGFRNAFTVVGSDIGDAVIERLESEWKAANVTTSTADVTSVVSILYESHSEWQRLQRAINTSSQIKDARLDGISKDGALMTVTYGGDMSRLTSELRGKGVDVRQDPDIGLVFARAGRF